MRILYVEDNEVNQALVARVTRIQNIEMVFCSEGEEALEMLANDPAIDLILMDIELAGVMTGLDVVTAMRARNDKRPVVAVTAYAMMGDREKMLDAGCDQYLPKPLQIPDLLTVFTEYAARFEAAEAAETPDPATDVPATNEVAVTNEVASEVKDAAESAPSSAAVETASEVADAKASTPPGNGSSQTPAPQTAAPQTAGSQSLAPQVEPPTATAPAAEQGEPSLAASSSKPAEG